MYESMITIYQKQMEIQIQDRVMKAVMNCGVDVDKEELIKALNYDRQQYEKGYEDAKRTMQWIPCSERLPDKEGAYLVFYNIGGGYVNLISYGYAHENDTIMCFYERDEEDWNCCIYGSIEAWMPLPDPYEESED